MRPLRALAALLARVLPSRGRHTRPAAPVDPPSPPPLPPWFGYHDTMTDIPPLRARPYVSDEDDEPSDTP